jgi:hypothetical protein
MIRTISDIASELTRERWCLFIATIEYLYIVTATTAVDLVVGAKRVAAQPVGATFQVHLREVNVYSLAFRGSDANTTVKVVSTTGAK